MHYCIETINNVNIKNVQILGDHNRWSAKKQVQWYDIWYILESLLFEDTDSKAPNRSLE